ncbi:MAG TPA: amylo-alpha-1,6-glucosidase [Bryobacteraceae bacterium]|nr:amylo-alpha-1,6-glucosidase [Bryobacteraceae bacterium]
MNQLLRSMPWKGQEANERDPLVTREWLVTNGLGGYASGTVSGVITRRFHGLLIAALPTPFGRRMMLNDVLEQLRFPDGHVVQLGGEERVNSALALHGANYLTEFRLERGLPVWTFQVGDVALEKRLVLPHRQNTVHMQYRVTCGKCDVRLELRPAMHFRPHEGSLGVPLEDPYVTTVVEDRYEFAAASGPPIPLRMLIYGKNSAFTFDRRQIHEVLYRIEESRGYEASGDLWSAGYFHVELSNENEATLVASTEAWDTIQALDPSDAFRVDADRTLNLVGYANPAAQEDVAAELVLAADQFVITPTGRREDEARARAAGDEVRTVIAGYHWFTDWGRDTMISLEGLTLTTGRYIEAGWILRTFAYYVRDGLIPNMFPEGEKEGLYHTADATLWFFHAIDRYIEITGDKGILHNILPKLVEIVTCHLQGTRFGIGVDASDGLLHQGAEGYQLTWMDAKVGDWVVTPRRGKAVEINALWYNALKLLEGWLRDTEQAPLDPNWIAGHAERTRQSFNARFWYEKGGYLYDVVDAEEGGNDSACRPNQLFSISLRHPVLDSSRWESVLNVCRDRLLTPVGLRSLAPGHPDYKAKYYGDLRSRDAAYHQGTVWAWLIGPFIDAWLKVHPQDRAGARAFLAGFGPHLGEACVGSISEVFDAEEPFTPRGCIAQAWSVAEVLRCWCKTADTPNPEGANFA